MKKISLQLEDDLIEALRGLARTRGVPVSRIVSEMVREGLPPVTKGRVRNGVRLFTPKPGSQSDMALVNSLRDVELTKPSIQWRTSS